MTDLSLFQTFLNQRRAGMPAFGSSRFASVPTDATSTSESGSTSFNPLTESSSLQDDRYEQDVFNTGQTTGLTIGDVQNLITNYKRPWNPESYWSLSS